MRSSCSWVIEVLVPSALESLLEFEVDEAGGKSKLPDMIEDKGTDWRRFIEEPNAVGPLDGQKWAGRRLTVSVEGLGGRRSPIRMSSMEVKVLGKLDSGGA